MQNHLFKSVVDSIVKSTPIFDLLGNNSAIVLERIARGGGATKWYYCSDKTRLETIQRRFSPGSVVSFYFDRRIKIRTLSADVQLEIETVIKEAGEVVIGNLSTDGLQIDVEIVSGPKGFEECELNLKRGDQVVYGEFPGRDNDGVRAVTITLPDMDGIVRAHPH